MSSEMKDYDPSLVYTEEELGGLTPGLGDAYAIANSALEAELSMDHWREQVRAPVTVISSDSEHEDTSSGEETDDPELQEAIRQSRQACRPYQRACAPPSPPFSYRKHSDSKSYKPLPRSQDLDARSTTPAKTPSLNFQAPRYDRQSRTRPASDMGKGLSCDMPLKDKASKFSPNTACGNLLNIGRLNTKMTAPTSDFMEDDL